MNGSSPEGDAPSRQDAPLVVIAGIVDLQTAVGRHLLELCLGEQELARLQDTRARFAVFIRSEVTRLVHALELEDDVRRWQLELLASPAWVAHFDQDSQTLLRAVEPELRDRLLDDEAEWRRLLAGAMRGDLQPGVTLQ